YTRSWGPFPNDVPDREASALFLHLNTNKRSVALDLKDSDDRAFLLKLVERADVLVESFRPGRLEDLGLGPATLQRSNPRLVITRISPFGQDGPYRDYAATGLTLQAMGGPMHGTGDAHRAPLRKPGFLEWYTVGGIAAEATMAGLFQARRSGTGSIIDLSAHEALLSGADRRAAFLLSAAYSGADAPRGYPSAHRGGASFNGKFEASDGLVLLYVTTPTFWNRLVRLISGDDQEFREKFLDHWDLGADQEEFLAYLRQWFRARAKADIMRAGQEARIPITAFLDVSEVFEHPHFRDRHTFLPAEHPRAGRLEYLRAPWRMDRGYELRMSAPLLGQHTAEIRTAFQEASESC
ncbi:MAG TPA: CoA transferase, partial [Candidatus Acidoferrum sp.]|nr:CoA transferase [Candidatus Acidoferrum sp.]